MFLTSVTLIVVWFNRFIRYIDSITMDLNYSKIRKGRLRICMQERSEFFDDLTFLGERRILKVSYEREQINGLLSIILGS